MCIRDSPSSDGNVTTGLDGVCVRGPPIFRRWSYGGLDRRRQRLATGCRISRLANLNQRAPALTWWVRGRREMQSSDVKGTAEE
eukprot:7164194-Prymnesium_polylepis.2